MDKQERTALTAKQAIGFIQSRAMVTEPGKYNLQVIGTPNLHEGRFIINLKAQTPSGLEKAKAALREKDFDGAANTNMTASVFPEQYVPSQGEHISCMVDYVEARDGSKILGVVSVCEIKSKSASKASLGDEFDNLLEEVTEEASEEPSLD